MFLPIIDEDAGSMEIEMPEVAAELLIEKIERRYADIVRLYRSVPVTKIVESTLRNGWSVKDVLAHISAWEMRCALLLQESHRTNGPLHAEPAVQALNKEIYQERQEWSWEEVEYEARAAHRALLKAIRQLPHERLNDETVQRTIAQDTWQHYEAHLSDLKQWHRRVNSNR